MTTKNFIEKLAGKDKDKIMGIDFDNYGFTIWLNEPYYFAVNEAGCLGFDWDGFDSKAELKQTLKEEWSMGIKVAEKN